MSDGNSSVTSCFPVSGIEGSLPWFSDWMLVGDVPKQPSDERELILMHQFGDIRTTGV